jgi:hypothetical protein
VVKKPFITVVSLTELHVLVLKCEAIAKYWLFDWWLASW